MATPLIYLLKVNDIDAIGPLNTLFRREVEAFLDKEIRAIEDFRFVESSGVNRFVSDEINYFMRCRNANCVDLGVDFAAFWGLTNFKDSQISQLSGGWRKFLSVSLRLSLLTRADVPLFFCFGRHLAQPQISRVISACNSLFDESVFVEYDISVIEEQCDCYELIEFDEKLLRHFLDNGNYKQ